jgi:hypothetical protein
MPKQVNWYPKRFVEVKETDRRGNSYTVSQAVPEDDPKLVQSVGSVSLLKSKIDVQVASQAFHSAVTKSFPLLKDLPVDAVVIYESKKNGMDTFNLTLGLSRGKKATGLDMFADAVA